MQKRHFYGALQDISNMCQPAELIGRSDVDDGRIPETMSQAAMKMVLDRTGGIKEDDLVANFGATTARPLCTRRAGSVPRSTT
jgi:hypothetical protein